MDEATKPVFEPSFAKFYRNWGWFRWLGLIVGCVLLGTALYQRFHFGLTSAETYPTALLGAFGLFAFVAAGRMERLVDWADSLSEENTHLKEELDRLKH